MKNDKAKYKKGALIFEVGVMSFFVLNMIASAMGTNLSDPIVQILESIFG
ncbi:hypothetical protein [Marinilactibacillus sp. Marseille-P9653]|nr:hypothetical protein [Marinilactibacillus sp. Marseille-P9653]